MANKLKLEVLTPDRAVFTDHVDSVVLPGIEGELGILPDHLPLMTTLSSGSLIITKGSERHYFAIHSGFAEVLPNAVIILTEAAEAADEIDVERARRALAEAEADVLRDASANILGEDDPHLTVAEQHKVALDRARARLFLAQEQKKGS